MDGVEDVDSLGIDASTACITTCILYHEHYAI